MALLHHLLEDRAPHTIVALTVDHQLREASSKEAQQVAAWCAKLGIEHTTLPWFHGTIVTGIQAKARKARYDLMADWCLKNHVPVLLTAHTQDDQAETVAMRQTRTTSEKSLSGIWPETQWRGIRILRPLLDHTRADLRTYLKSINQTWIEDPSNDDTRFERIRMRQRNPNLALAKIAAAAQITTREAAENASRWRDQNVIIAPTGMMTLPRLKFCALPASIQDEIILHLIHRAGGGPTELAERIRLQKWLKTSQANRRTLGGALFVKRQADIRVAREPARISTQPVTLAANQPIMWDKRFCITSTIGSSIVSAYTIKSLKRNTEIPDFVFKGLPVATLNGQILAVHCALIHPDITCELNTN